MGSFRLCAVTSIQLSILIVVFLLLLHTAQCDETTIDYSGYKVLRLHPTTPKGIAVLDRLQDNNQYGLDFLTERANQDVSATLDVAVPPQSLNYIIRILKKSQIAYSVKIQDLQVLIDEEAKDMKDSHHKRRVKRSTFESSYGSGFWKDAGFDPGLPAKHLDAELFYWFNIIGQYVSADELNEWLNFAVLARKDLVTLEVIGHSFQKRELKVVKIRKKSANGKKKPIIWIDAGIHAREWITTATAVYIIYQLIDGDGKYSEVTRMLEMYDWYILPLHNPDGYEYSRNHNRMWRKNRAPTFNHRCTGVDLNRNYGFEWKSCIDSPYAKYCIDTEKPCTNIYGGPEPFSEPESKAVSDYILKYSSRIKMYLSLHSYSQLWLLPWGYTKVPPKDVKELNRVAKAGASALQDIYGTVYFVGSPAQILYYVGGSTMDWAKGTARIPYTYTLELRDKGASGFLLPQNQVVPTANETFIGIRAAVFAISSPPQDKLDPQKNREDSQENDLDDQLDLDY